MKKQIVIVGGGTAGWMSALWAQHLYNDGSADITLIESEDIGILGAGEGSIPRLMDFLQFVKIDYNEFMVETNATHKLGVSFENWDGNGKKYIHDFFSTNPDNVPICDSEYWGFLMKNGYDLNDKIASKYMAYNNKSAISLNNTQMVNFSFHFDAHLVASYFKKIAESRGVKRIEGVITNFVQNRFGDIKTIELENETKVENIHFVFDCSGFKRLIIGKLYNTEWISYKDRLTVNSALPFQLPQSKTDIATYTKAIAMKYGWLWQIPLQSRWGCGYVFDNNYINSDEAKKEVENLLGHEIECNRTISFEPGRYKSNWINNCIGVGLSTGFVEPLEATAIGMVIIGLLVLTKFDIDFKDPYNMGQYNWALGELNDDIVDFLQYHYITKRTDTEFWNRYRDEKYMSKKLISTISGLKESLNFNRKKESVFSTSGWRLVGYGNGILDENLFIKSYDSMKDNSIILDLHSNMEDVLNEKHDKLIDEIDFLKRIKQKYGKS